MNIHGLDDLQLCDYADIVAKQFWNGNPTMMSLVIAYMCFDEMLSRLQSERPNSYHFKDIWALAKVKSAYKERVDLSEAFRNLWSLKSLGAAACVVRLFLDECDVFGVSLPQLHKEKGALLNLLWHFGGIEQRPERIG